MAVGTFTYNITVGQELLGLLVVELCSGLLHQFAFVIEFLEPLGSKLMMRVAGGTAIDIE